MPTCSSYGPDTTIVARCKREHEEIGVLKFEFTLLVNILVCSCSSAMFGSEYCFLNPDFKNSQQESNSKTFAE